MQQKGRDLTFPQACANGLMCCTIACLTCTCWSSEPVMINEKALNMQFPSPLMLLNPVGLSQWSAQAAWLYSIRSLILQSQFLTGSLLPLHITRMVFKAVIVLFNPDNF